MMTLKLVRAHRVKIVEAECFTVLHESTPDPQFDALTAARDRRELHWAEITGHHSKMGDFRYDVGESPHPEKDRIFEFAYIMNEAGKTIEQIHYGLHGKLIAA